jgi:hypothetical protein
MLSDIKDRIWRTARIRMKSEARVRDEANYFNILIVWYSTILTILTVYQLVAAQDDVRDLVSAALSIGLLSASIFVPSMRKEYEADKFRECYLKLQQLLDQNLSEQKLKERYHDILQQYPNHKVVDHIAMLIGQAKSGDPVKIRDVKVPVTFSMKWTYFLYHACRFVMAFTFICAPLLLFYVL